MTSHGGLDQTEDFLEKSTKSPERVRDHLQSVGIDPYIETIQSAAERGDSFKLWSDEDYPANLGLWGARPAVLFYRGDLTHLNSRSLALVGRVDPTPRGEDAAHKFGRLCVENEITVVSGLAKGIDGASHRAALADPPGYTYAVVGHGLDFAYPAENHDLYEEIPQRGAVISQFPPGVGPQRWTFPARNEVMCTLALGTVIVEGKPGCGSIIQAEFSFKHGRPVFLLSRNLRTGDTAWAEELVEKGAHVIETFDQALDIVRTTMSNVWGAEVVEPAVQDALFSVAPTPTTPAPGDFGRGATLPASSSPGHSGSRPGGTTARARYALLFDIDGVIADSRDTTAAALAEIIRRHTGRTVDTSFMDVTGKPHDILSKYGVKCSYDVYRSEYNREFARSSVAHMRTFDEAVEALHRLRRAGIKLAAITAQPKSRAEKILPPEIRSLFDIFLAYNETKGKKEFGISSALSQFGVSHTHAAYIGDQVQDIRAAHLAHVRRVGVAWGFSDPIDLRNAGAEIILDSPTELNENIIAKLFGT
ncbi:DNA-processing protein DprA [Gordonia sp. FQ]|uniref:DNA-processing protein DprA n=2 Tax=Gordonia TaxID=2053 RepID=UPI003F85FA35